MTTQKIIGQLQGAYRKDLSPMELMRVFGSEGVDYRNVTEYDILVCSEQYVAPDIEPEFARFNIYTENREAAEAFVDFWKEFDRMSRRYGILEMAYLGASEYFQVMSELFTTEKFSVAEAKATEYRYSFHEDDANEKSGVVWDGRWSISSENRASSEYFVLEQTVDEIKQATQRLSSVEVVERLRDTYERD